MGAVPARRRSVSFFASVGRIMASSLVGQVAVIGSGVVTARALGPTDRGHLALMMLVPLALSQFAQLGSAVAVNYYVAADQGLSRSGMRNVCNLAARCIGAGIVLAAVIEGIWRWLDRGHTWDPVVFLTALIVIAAYVVFDYSNAAMQGAGYFRAVAYTRSIPAVGYGVLAPLLWWLVTDASQTTFYLAWAVSIILAAAISAWVAATIGIPRLRDERTRSIEDIRAFGTRAFVGAMAPIDSFRLDQVFGAWWIGANGLGLYVVAQAFSTLPRILASNAGFVIYSDIAKGEQDPSAEAALLRRIGLLSMINAAICIGLVILAPVLNDWFFGAHFHDAVPASRVLIISAWVWSIRKALTEIAKGRGNPGLQTRCELGIIPLALVSAAALSPFAWSGPLKLAGAVLLAQILVLAACFMVRQLRLDAVTALGCMPRGTT